MQSEFGSDVGAPSGASGSSEPSASLPSEAEPSLIAAMLGLVQQLAETNVHLLMLADQTAKCLAHMALLVDLLASSEEEDEAEPRTYLDGTPIS